MDTVRTCVKCGAAIPKAVLAGLCPRCVAKLTLESAAAEPAGLENQPGAAAGAPPSVPVTNPLIRYFGDYELLGEIGRGGMGVVYKARQRSLNRVVAVKMLLHGGFASEEFVRRFHTEAEAAASLQHPGIVAIHEVGVHEGLHYFSMDYVEGPNLAELLRNGPVAADRAARYVQLIAEAMHYAHQRGILHRDLKPSNVVIDAFNQTRVTDFGLAKRLTPDDQTSPNDAQLTLTGQILGAPSYMPPEQAGGRRSLLGVQSDVYALGAILYHLLTGRPPFLGQTIHETLLQVQTQEPKAPRQLNPAVPADLEAVCLKCLRKNPSDRYESAEALAADLRRWRAGEQVLARLDRQSRLDRYKWLKHPASVTALVVLALALVLALVFGINGWIRKEHSVAKAPAVEVKQSPTVRQPEAEAAHPPSSRQLPTPSWSRGPDLLESLGETRAIVLEGKLYVVGGRTGHGNQFSCVSTVQVYDPQLDKWGYAPPLPERVAAVGLAVHGGYLYCFGGIREAFWWGWPVASAYRFDPRSGSWKRLADMPIARSNFAVGVVGDRIYCAGGNIHWPNATDRVDAYDVSADKWVDAGVMPRPRGSCAGGPWRNMLVITPGLPSAAAAVDQRLFVADPENLQVRQSSRVQWEVDNEANLLFSDEAGVYCLARTNRQSAQIFICRLNVETGDIAPCDPPSPVSHVLPMAAYDTARGVAYLVGGDGGERPGKALEKARIAPAGSASF